MKEYMKDAYNTVSTIVKPVIITGMALYMGCGGGQKAPEPSDFAKLIGQYGRSANYNTLQIKKGRADSIRVGGKFIEFAENGVTVVGYFDEKACTTEGRVKNGKVVVDQTHAPAVVLGLRKGDVEIDIVDLNADDEPDYAVARRHKEGNEQPEVAMTDHRKKVRDWYDGIKGALESGVDSRLKARQEKKNAESEKERKAFEQLLEDAGKTVEDVVNEEF